MWPFFRFILEDTDPYWKMAYGDQLQQIFAISFSSPLLIKTARMMGHIASENGAVNYTLLT